MLLDHRFYRLPFNVDAQRIQKELSKICDTAWISHPNSYQGNSALPLISVNGEDNHDVIGEMALCPRLEQMPYVKYVLSSLNTDLGRSRFMRLAEGSSVPPHCDTSLYWLQRMRIHIPITTNPSVIFKSGEQTQHMAAGEAWVLDTWHKHSVSNQGDERIHLVVDTQGTELFWLMLNTLAWRPNRNETTLPSNFNTQEIKANSDLNANAITIPLELNEYQTVLNPNQISQVISFYLSDLAKGEDNESARKILTSLEKNWQTIWGNYGSDQHQHLRYRMLVLHAIGQLESLDSPACSKTNGQPLSALLTQIITNLSTQNISIREISHADSKPSSIDYSSVSLTPIFIVAAPRSGSTLLYETLGCHDALMHYGAESHNLIESITSLSMEANDSNVLTENHATMQTTNAVKQQFLQQLNEQELLAKQHINFLEKTPKNALGIDFLNATFPNARFIYMFRQPNSNLSSIVDGWKSGRFVTYRNLKGWNGKYPWSFLLPKGWRGLPTNDLATIANFQYCASNQSIIDSLSKLNKSQTMALSYESFIENPGACLQNICDFLDIQWSENFDKAINKTNGLPLSKYTLDAPSEDKWRRNETLLSPVLKNAQKFYRNEILPAEKLINLKS